MEIPGVEERKIREGKIKEGKGESSANEATSQQSHRDGLNVYCRW